MRLCTVVRRREVITFPWEIHRNRASKIMCQHEDQPPRHILLMWEQKCAQKWFLTLVAYFLSPLTRFCSIFVSEMGFAREISIQSFHVWLFGSNHLSVCHKTDVKKDASCNTWDVDFERTFVWDIKGIVVWVFEELITEISKRNGWRIQFKTFIAKKIILPYSWCFFFLY